jgi:predicted methyltransferase
MIAATRIGALFATLALCAAGAADASVPGYITKAVASSSRPDKDRERDPDRKPEQVLAFAGIHPGQRVAELMPGGGYYSRLLCRVIGPKGHLYTISLTRAVGGEARSPDVAAAAPAADACTNVTADSQSAAGLKLPAGLDAVWTTENYHDLHNATFGSPDMRIFDRAVFDALKPGGVFIVEDHVAEAGSAARDTQTLHRIDPELVKREALSAGFVLDGSSEALRNPDDAHTLKVFELKGRSDKFLFRFRKPGR